MKSDPKIKTYKGITSLFFAGFFYAFYGVFSRLMGNDFANFFQAWSRGLIVFFVLLIIGFYCKSFKKFEKADYKWLLLASIGSSLTIAPFYIAAVNIPIGIALLLFYAANTIFSFLVGYYLFGEKLNNKKVIALLIAFVGLVTVYYENIAVYDFSYLLLSAISGILFAFYFLFSKKVSGKYSPTQINAFMFFMVFMVNLVISLMLHEKFYFDFVSPSWFANYGYVIAQVLATFLVVSGFKKVEAQVGSLILLSEVIFTVLFGYLFFKEIPGNLSIVGGVLIFVAMALPNVTFLEKKNI